MPGDGFGGGDHVLRVATVRAVETRKKAVAGAVHVVANTATATQPTARLGVQDDWIALGQIRHTLANLLNPAGILVPEAMANAIASGRATNPTVTPAIRSSRNLCLL